MIQQANLAKEKVRVVHGMRLEWLKQDWLQTFFNAEFVSRVIRETAVVWPCKVNG
jgi:hypothetical protein